MKILLWTLVLFFGSIAHAKSTPDFPGKIYVAGMLGMDKQHPSIAILEEAYRQVGIKKKMILLPTARAKVELDKGITIDGILLASGLYAQEHPKWQKIPIVLSNSDFNVITNKAYIGAIDWSAIDK
jgi:hypothetical protein